MYKKSEKSVRWEKLLTKEENTILASLKFRLASTSCKPNFCCNYIKRNHTIDILLFFEKVKLTRNSYSIKNCPEKHFFRWFSPVFTLIAIIAFCYSCSKCCFYTLLLICLFFFWLFNIITTSIKTPLIFLKQT